MCRYKATKAISDDVQIVVAKEIRDRKSVV